MSDIHGNISIQVVHHNIDVGGAVALSGLDLHPSQFWQGKERTKKLKTTMFSRQLLAEQRSHPIYISRGLILNEGVLMVKTETLYYFEYKKRFFRGNRIQTET